MQERPSSLKYYGTAPVARLPGRDIPYGVVGVIHVELDGELQRLESTIAYRTIEEALAWRDGVIDSDSFCDIADQHTFHLECREERKR